MTTPTIIYPQTLDPIPPLVLAMILLVQVVLITISFVNMGIELFIYFIELKRTPLITMFIHV